MTDASRRIPVVGAVGGSADAKEDARGRRLRGATGDVPDGQAHPKYEAKGRGGRATRKREFTTKAHKDYLKQHHKEQETDFIKQADMAVKIVEDSHVVPLFCAFKYVSDTQPLNVAGRSVKGHASQNRIVQMYMTTLDKRRSINVTCRASDLDWTQLTSDQQMLVLPAVTGLTQTEPVDKELWALVHSDKRPGGPCDPKILAALDDAQKQVVAMQRRLDATVEAANKQRATQFGPSYDSTTILDAHFDKMRAADRKERRPAEEEDKTKADLPVIEEDEEGTEAETKTEVKEAVVTAEESGPTITVKSLKATLTETALRQRVEHNAMGASLKASAMGLEAQDDQEETDKGDPLKKLTVEHMSNVVIRGAMQAVMTAREARMRAMYSALPRLQDEWQRVVNFFMSCGTSVCLLAHNGSAKAFKALQEETLQKDLVWPKSVNFLRLDTSRLYKSLFPQLKEKTAKTVTLVELFEHASRSFHWREYAVMKLDAESIAYIQKHYMSTAKHMALALLVVFVPSFVHAAIGSPALSANVRELFIKKTGPGAEILAAFEELGIKPRDGSLENGFDCSVAIKSVGNRLVDMHFTNGVASYPDFYEALLLKALGVGYVGMLPIRGASRLILEVDDEGNTKMRLKNTEKYTRGLKHSSYQALEPDIRKKLHEMVGAYLNAPVDHPRFWQGVVYYSDVRPEGETESSIAATATVTNGGLKPEDADHSLILFNLCGNPDLAVADNVEWLVATIKASASDSFEALDQICAVVHKDDKTVPQALYRLGFLRETTGLEDAKELEKEKHKETLSEKEVQELEAKEAKEGRKTKQEKRQERKARAKKPKKQQTTKSSTPAAAAAAAVVAETKAETKTPPPSPAVAPADETELEVPVLPLELPAVTETKADAPAATAAAAAEIKQEPREPSAMRLWVLRFESKKSRLSRGADSATATTTAGDNKKPAPPSGLAAQVIAAGVVDGLGAKGCERLRKALNADLFLHLFKLYGSDEQFGNLLDFAFSGSTRGLIKTTRDRLIAEARSWFSQQTLKRMPVEAAAGSSVPRVAEGKTESKAKAKKNKHKNRGKAKAKAKAEAKTEVKAEAKT